MRKKELLNFKDGKLRNLNEEEFSCMLAVHTSWNATFLSIDTKNYFSYSKINKSIASDIFSTYASS